MPSSFQERGGWPTTLAKVTRGESLSREQAFAVMSEMLSGQASQAQMGGLLVGLRVKGESAEEMTGFVNAMFEASEPLKLPDEAIDIVGTGGSPHRQAHALNASTMACIVAAAAGAIICKHGNRKASSTSGSFDFLEALGVPIDLTARQLERCVSDLGIGFAFARAFHPAMRHAGPVRSELGIPTVFNTLGPLAHPGRVKRQLIGVSTEAKAKVVAEVLQQLGTRRSWVVAGADGLDEVSTSGPSVVYEATEDGIERRTIELGAVGIERVELAKVAGGSAEDNVAIFTKMIDGQPSPHRDLVVLNAGAALVVAGLADELGDGIAQAETALDSGSAYGKLAELTSFTVDVE